MEDKKMSGKDAYVCTCCSHYGHGGWYPGALLRIVIGVIIALGIFWVGVKVGEFHDRLSGFGGYGRGGYMMMRGGSGMMRGYGAGGIPPVPTNATATSTAPSTVK